ncbi:MAG: hypothetical protein QM781_07640 [Chitinophagaceae bacterium]
MVINVLEKEIERQRRLLRCTSVAVVGNESTAIPLNDTHMIWLRILYWLPALEGSMRFILYRDWIFATDRAIGIE